MSNIIDKMLWRRVLARNHIFIDWSITTVMSSKGICFFFFFIFLQTSLNFKLFDVCLFFFFSFSASPYLFGIRFYFSRSHSYLSEYGQAYDISNCDLWMTSWPFRSFQTNFSTYGAVHVVAFSTSIISNTNKSK